MDMFQKVDNNHAIELVVLKASPAAVNLKDGMPHQISDRTNRLAIQISALPHSPSAA
jgi:hypothetical protein